MRRDLPLAEHRSSVTANVSEGGKAASRDARKDANPGTGIRAQTHRLTGSATFDGSFSPTTPNILCLDTVESQEVEMDGSIPVPS